MADETVDLRFLAEQLKRVLGELGEIRAEQERSAALLGRVTDAVTAVAATQDDHTEVLTRHSAILEHHSGLLEQINETQRSYGGRLNIIDGRLAIIEKRIGLVQA